jgi:uncharacterized YigZ family protein
MSDPRGSGPEAEGTGQSGRADAAASDRYLTVRDGPETELKEKGSRFLARALAVRDEEESAARLLAVRKRYHAATHHCWAHRLGPPESLFEKADDDGEPSGTAGIPILQALQSADVHGALVVVTRWFGGTKLGTGGLARAYGDAARQAVDAAPRRVIWREVVLEVTVGYADVGNVEAVLAREAGSVRGCKRTFDGDPRFLVRTLRSRAADLAAAITEATGGRARSAGADGPGASAPG